MKWLGILLMTTLLAGAPGYLSAQQAGEKGATPPPQPTSSPEAAKQTQPAKSYTKEERQPYEKKTAETLDAMQKKLEDLRGKLQQVPMQSRRVVLRHMANLQRGLVAAKTQFADMQKASPQAWGEMKADLDRALATWERDYADVASRLH